ncbi:MAG: acetylglutamate kinase [Candidatus Pelagibacterales bacterium]|nr:MAG: acetylglutamate kinase [Pelagibacterales bacterium]
MFPAKNLDSKIKEFWPKDGPQIQEVDKYVKKYSKEKIVIKCGGRVLIDSNLFNNFINDVSILKKLGLTPIVVHGGGPRIKKKLDELNIETKFIMGLRVTDEKVIKVVEDVMIKFNTEIVDALKKKGCLAKSITVKENLIPVVSPMGIDQNNQTYNINADTAAGALARSVRSRRLMLMTDVEGVYDKNKKLISEIKSAEAEKLIYDQTISEGMIPKIRTCIKAVNDGVRGVVIIDGRRPHSILFELFSDKGAGTLIRK